MKKKWEFSRLGEGGTLILDIFSHFQQLVSKHALNYAKMEKEGFSHFLNEVGKISTF